MNKKISIGEKKYLLKGAWNLDGIKYIFNGTVVEDGNEKKSPIPLNYAMPLSMMKKFGKKFMEEDIVTTVIDSLKKKK